MSSITLLIENQYTKIIGAPKSLLKLMDDATSYRVEGYWFSWMYKSKRWDGKQHLLKQNASGVSFPTGLLEDITSVLDECEWPWHIDDKRVSKPPTIFRWNEEIVLRDYQSEAVDKFLDKGFGILKMPIRSGKTKTAARIIYRLGQPTLFIVPSKTLLYQTAESLEECFPDEKIGKWGDGLKDIQWITVVIAASLVFGRSKKTDLYKEMCERVGLIVFDEAHHLTAGGWCEVMMDFKGRYRLGLSATPMLDVKKAASKGVIWLKAACGPIRIDVDMSKMIRQGHLVAPTFHLYTIRGEKKHIERGWSQGLASDVIFLNPKRNRTISRLARIWASRGKRVLIVTRRVDQAELIAKDLFQASLVVGEVPQNQRESMFKDFVSKKVPIMIGTIFKEGIDIPEIDVVINAEGGHDFKSTVQRWRNLTPCEGKDVAIIIDFMDLSNPYFAAHSRARLKVMRSESAFKIELKVLNGKKASRRKK